jgi:hypothetical protein
VVKPRWFELVISRMCRSCGREFKARRIQQWYCGGNCRMRAWRAAKQLEGTHGMRPDHTWGRL